MAILALVMAFAFAPDGLILASSTTSRSGRPARTATAHAGRIIVGGIVTAMFGLFTVLWLIALATFDNSGSFGR